MQYFIESILLLMPILAANQGPGLARKLNLPLSHLPVSRRWLGENKTVAAYYAGPALAMLVSAPPLNPHWLVEGLVLGLGAVLGDHAKSLYKRWRGIPPGAPFFLDRIDFAIGGGAAAWLCIPWASWPHLLWLVALAWPIHYFGNRFSHSQGWRDTPH